MPADNAGSLQILVHGATSSRWYWDPEVLPEKYSYVNAATARGLATLNLDLVGYGRSSHPLGTELGFDLHAATICWAATHARTDLAGFSWQTIVGVGHSLGAGVLMVAMNNDADLSAAVLTGISHERKPTTPVTVVGAESDPLFQQRRVGGYVTFPSGSRTDSYHLPSTDPAVLLADEAHRDVLGVADIEDFMKVIEAKCKARIPLLIALGSEDSVYIARDDEDFRSTESEWYPLAPSIDFRVYADIGHSINLHATSDRAVRDILDWVEGLRMAPAPVL